MSVGLVGVILSFVLGVVLMRSAGCVMNDYADREFDPQVERTRNRPLAAGQIELIKTRKGYRMDVYPTRRSCG